MGVLLITSRDRRPRQPRRRHRLRGRRPAHQVLRSTMIAEAPGRTQRGPQRRARGRGRRHRHGRKQEAGDPDYEVGLESLSQWQLAWRKFRKHHLALIGLGILAALFVDRDRRAVPAAVRVQRRSPGPTRSCSHRPAAVAGPPVRRDRRPPARRPDARRQRRPDVALHRLREHVHRRVHRHGRRCRSPGSSAASPTTS